MHIEHDLARPEQLVSEKKQGGSRLPAGHTAVKGAIRILVFFCCFALLAIALNAAITHGLRSIRTSKFGAFNTIISGTADADIVISGSSRALCHYDPRIIEAQTGLSVFNTGMNASQIDLQLAVLKTYLRHNRKPKLIIQNLDLFSFETTHPGSLYDPGYFVPYLDEPALYEMIREIEPNAWKWKFLPLYGYAVEDMRFTWIWGILGCFGVNGPEDYYRGFNPRPKTWNEDFDKFKASLNSKITYKIESKGIRCLEEILDFCASQGIPLILAYSPEYSEMQGLEANRAEIMHNFHTMAQKHKVPFWDYSDSSISATKAMFNNSQHLNAAGAAVFSEELGKRIAPLVSSRDR